MFNNTLVPCWFGTIIGIVLLIIIPYQDARNTEFDRQAARISEIETTLHAINVATETHGTRLSQLETNLAKLSASFIEYRKLNADVYGNILVSLGALIDTVKELNEESKIHTRALYRNGHDTRVEMSQ